MKRADPPPQVRPIRIGLTLGDVNGIGPELCVRTALAARPPPGVAWVLIGDAATVAREAQALDRLVPPAWSPAPNAPLPGRAVLWDPRTAPSPRVHPGRVRADAGRASAAWVQAGARACTQGLLDGLVTAPICKAAWHRAGLDWPGHTELLAAEAHVSRVAMMLLGGRLRVVLATRHVPLAHVPRLLDRADLAATLTLTCRALEWMGCKRTRVAVCGLNPHAGEGGLLGDEEKRIIAPAVAAARRRGVDATGPIPGDTAFHLAAEGQFEAVLAMYHDQGLAPLKLEAFETGVNLTLGLPWVRTSPDHGTAFDLAGRGCANLRSMQAAARLAIRLARRTNPWAGG